MDTNTQFLGEDGFLFFMGVVEDINDPEKLGRMKVRVYGCHTQDKGKIPTEELPWALPVMPVHSAFTDGVGTAPVGIVCSSLVFGFWLDGPDKQVPVILGTLGGISRFAPNGDVGFNDPDECFPFLLDLPTTNIAARGTKGKYAGEHPATTWRKDNVLDGTTCNGNWKEPKTPSDPTYPWNSVREFRYDKPCHGEDWGHVEEFDSTPGRERILVYHHKTKNNFLEIHHTGDEVHKITGDGYELNLKDKTLLVKGDYKIEVEGNRTEYIHGNYCLLVDGNYTQTVGGHKTVDIGEFQSTVIADYDKWDIGSYRKSTIGSYEDLDIGSYRTTTISTLETIDIGSYRTTSIGSYENLDIGSYRTTSIGSYEDLDIGSYRTTTISTLETIDIGDDRTTTIGASDVETVGTNFDLTVGGNINFTASIFDASQVPLTILDELTLTTVINGLNVSGDVSGSGSATITGIAYAADFIQA